MEDARYNIIMLNVIAIDAVYYNNCDGQIVADNAKAVTGKINVW